MKNFEGKTALVVGGSGGIGFEISRMLFKNGANLIIHGRNLQKLEKARQKLKSEFENKPEIKIVPFDLFPGTPHLETAVLMTKADLKR